MLTRKQHDLLAFIDRFTRENGWAPSFQDMMLAIGVKSKATIFVKLAAMEERGFIRRPKHRARAIEVLKLPERLSPGANCGTGIMLAIPDDMPEEEILAVVRERRALKRPTAQTLQPQCHDNALTMPAALE